MNGIQTNKTTITVITTTVALMAFVCVGSICALAYWGIQIPPELNTLTGTLCGGLTGMLVKTAPTETSRQAPATGVQSGVTPVQVVNEPKDPVPTTAEEPK